jgi:hypothetical protein
MKMVAILAVLMIATPVYAQRHADVVYTNSIAKKKVKKPDLSKLAIPSATLAALAMSQQDTRAVSN